MQFGKVTIEGSQTRKKWVSNHTPLKTEMLTDVIIIMYIININYIIIHEVFISMDDSFLSLYTVGKKSRKRNNKSVTVYEVFNVRCL